MARALKVLGFIALIMWMAWVSLTLIQIRSIALEACGLAAVHGEDASGGISLPVECPALDYNEVKSGRPK
jgi:hypothetical protein